MIIMDLTQQISQMSNELDNLCDRWAQEYEIPFAVAIGILATKTNFLMHQAEDAERDRRNEGNDS